MNAGATRVYRVLTAITLLVIGLTTVVAEPIARVTSLEGRPEVARDNRDVLVDIEAGFRFEAFDYIETDEDTIVNLELLPLGESPARMVIEPNSALVLFGGRAVEDSPRGESPLQIALFAGSLSVSGAHVAVSRPEVHVEATTAEFSVIAGPGGGTLVLATGGIVSARTDTGVQLFAEPGDAVEIAPVGDLARTREYERATAGSFPLFWLAEREALLDSCIETHTERALTRYEAASQAFADAYAALMAERDVIDEWAEQDRLGQLEPLTTLDAERLEPIMEEVREQLVAYRQAVAMLESLADIQPVIVAEVSVPSGLDGAQAIEEIEEERLQMSRWLQQTLYALNLFEQRPQSLGM